MSKEKEKLPLTGCSAGNQNLQIPKVKPLLKFPLLLSASFLGLAMGCQANKLPPEQRFLERKINHCQGCNLSARDLSLRAFEGADLSGANLQNAVLGAAQLRKANFSGANLEGAVLRQANLAGAKFDGANLSGADFHCGAGSCTHLSQTSFKGANLTGADFRAVGFTPVGEVGLPEVDFTGANLQGANFERASFKGAFLDGARLCQTTLPDGQISHRNC